jgi:predicted DsbA family dithiol-disulfide isomerase
LGLDAAAFRKCLASGRHGAAIRQDMKEVQALGITVTPAYLIGRRVPGGKVEILHSIGGLPPYDYLEKKLDELLAPKSSPK